MLDVLHVSSDLRRLSPSAIAGLVLLAAAAVILAALAFEHVGGYTPCPLCLQQRYAYYLGIPALAAALALLRMARPKAAAAVLLAVGIAFLVNAGLGVYQAGAEWRFWEPPATCATPAELPMRVVVPAYAISELKTGFQMGFFLFVPFLLIDLVVSTTLLSMGMMQLPPAMVSLPFKVLLFVMVDGWNLLVGSLVRSFV